LRRRFSPGWRRGLRTFRRLTAAEASATNDSAGG
jgi:hypothetical protein